MATARQTRTKKSAVAEKLGLLANGSAGSWEVAVDTTTAGAERWFLQIDGPRISFQFELSSPMVVDRMIRFLEGGAGHESARNGTNGRLSISKDTDVNLVRDVEFHDRYFLTLAKRAKTVVELTIAGSDRQQLIEALRQASADLSQE